MLEIISTDDPGMRARAALRSTIAGDCLPALRSSSSRVVEVTAVEGSVPGTMIIPPANMLILRWIAIFRICYFCVTWYVNNICQVIHHYHQVLLLIL